MVEMKAFYSHQQKICPKLLCNGRAGPVSLKSAKIVCKGGCGFFFFFSGYCVSDSLYSMPRWLKLNILHGFKSNVHWKESSVLVIDIVKKQFFVLLKEISWAIKMHCTISPLTPIKFANNLVKRKHTKHMKVFTFTRSWVYNLKLW